MGEKRIISVVSKGNNPVATSRIFYNIKNTEGPRTVIYLTDDERPDLNHTCPGWIFMSDFAYLKDVDQVIFMTKYAGNAQFTAVLDGVPPERIHIADHLEQIPDQIDPQRRETIFILHDIEDYTQNMARELIAQLRRRIGGNQ